METRSLRVLSVAAFLCCPAIAGSPLRLRWSELPRELDVRWKIALALPDGAHVQGRFVAVEPNALVLQISKTSNKILHPKGRTEIPRASVRELRILRMGWIWRAVLTPTVTFLSLGLAAYAAWNARDSAGEVGAFAIPVAVGFGTYYGAKMLDRRTKTLIVVPE